MQTKDFYFDLPERLIAQHPKDQRDQSRLLVVHRSSGELEHRHFFQVLDYLKAGDCLVINNTRVLPARIYGIKDSGAKVEFLLLKQMDRDHWETLVKPGKRANVGAHFNFSPTLQGEIVGLGEEGTRIVKFHYEGAFLEHLAMVGTMPLPPYIQASLEDQERYQTVYSEIVGSSAAPTAGLHFTHDLLAAVEAKGVKVVPVTLHVGLGTFRPVKVMQVETHVMHEERYALSEASARVINETKASGGRVIAVGTTSVRTLESCADEAGILHAGEGETSIFIYPGYNYKCVDALITNFHLPESTLLMLVSAFSSKELIFKAYDVAIEADYRFFSFGDAMLITD